MIEIIPNTLAIDPAIIEFMSIRGEGHNRTLLLGLRGQEGPFTISRADHADVNVDLAYSKLITARQAMLPVPQAEPAPGPGVPNDAKRAAGRLKWAIEKAESLGQHMNPDSPEMASHAHKVDCAKTALTKLLMLTRP